MAQKTSNTVVGAMSAHDKLSPVLKDCPTKTLLKPSKLDAYLLVLRRAKSAKLHLPVNAKARMLPSRTFRTKRMHMNGKELQKNCKGAISTIHRANIRMQILIEKTVSFQLAGLQGAKMYRQRILWFM